MTVDLSEDELNILLSALGMALNLMSQSDMKYQMEQVLALQRKLMAARGEPT